MPRLSCRAVIGIVLSAAVVGCASAPTNRPLKVGAVNSGPGTLTEARQYLEGHWTLVSFDIFPPGEPPIHAAATGTMVYDDFANMDIVMQFNPESATLAERIGMPIKDGVLKTSGRTVIDIGSRSLSYVLEGQQGVRVATHPLDTNRPRYWEVSGDTLTLRTKSDAGDVLSVSVWRKG